jgi:hypothetical protein
VGKDGDGTRFLSTEFGREQSGSDMVNSVPCPNVLETSMVPPCAAMTARQMLRPPRATRGGARASGPCRYGRSAQRRAANRRARCRP